MNNKKHVCAGALTCILLAAAPYAAYAEEKKLETFELDPVVVTASRVQRHAKDVSPAVQVITQSELQSVGATNLTDALHMATGVQIANNAGTGKKSPMIRGFDSRFSTILINGRRLASEPDQLYELNRITLANVERIEVVRGPMSALYGTEALGGIINIITKNSDTQSVTLSGDLGFYNQNDAKDQNYNFDFQSGQVGRFRYSLYASYRDNDPTYKSNGYTFEPYGNHKNFGGRIEYDLSKSEVLAVDISHEEEKTNEISARGPAALGSPLRRTLDDNQRNEQSISYTKKTDNTEVFFRFYNGLLKKNVDQLNNNTGNLMVPAGANASWVRAERTMRAFEGRLTRKASEKHTVTFGAEYRPEKFKGTSVNTGEDFFTVTYKGTTKTGSTANLDYYGVYLMDEWQVTPKFRAVTALRYDDSNKFESDWSPKLGLIYQFTDQSRVKFNAGHAFRSPTPNQLYNIDPQTKGNPNLKSEKANSFDVSYEKEFSRSGYKLTYFYNDVKDLIEVQNQMYQNIAKATIQGVEAEYLTQINDNWSWINSWAYLDATDDTTSQRLRGRARNLLSSRIAYSDNKYFSASFWGELYHDYLPTIPNISLRERSYVTWNIAGSYNLNKNTKLILGVNDIFDKQDEDANIIGRYAHLTVQFKF